MAEAFTPEAPQVFGVDCQVRGTTYGAGEIGERLEQRSSADRRFGLHEALECLTNQGAPASAAAAPSDGGQPRVELLGKLQRYALHGIVSLTNVARTNRL